MGNLAAGELDIALKGKSFGVLGQGNPLNYTNGTSYTYGSAMHGFTQNYEPSDKSTCKTKFMAVNVIFLGT